MDDFIKAGGIGVLLVGLLFFLLSMGFFGGMDSNLGNHDGALQNSAYNAGVVIGDGLGDGLGRALDGMANTLR